VDPDGTIAEHPENGGCGRKEPVVSCCWKHFGVACPALRATKEPPRCKPRSPSIVEAQAHLTEQATQSHSRHEPTRPDRTLLFRFAPDRSNRDDDGHDAIGRVPAIATAHEITLRPELADALAGLRGDADVLQAGPAREWLDPQRLRAA
jgi:hypothetical protein